MKREDIRLALRYIETIDRLHKLKEEVHTRFSKISKNSTHEEIMEFFEFLIKTDNLQPVIEGVYGCIREIDNRIKEL